MSCLVLRTARSASPLDCGYSGTAGDRLKVPPLGKVLKPLTGKLCSIVSLKVDGYAMHGQVD